MKKFFSSFIVISLTLFCLAGNASALIMADVVFMVDESGSMSTVQTNLRNNIATFASILSAGGVDAQFGLVGYGGSYYDSNGYYLGYAPRLLTGFTDTTTFATAAQSLIAYGGTEPGYDAINFSLTDTGLVYRAGAVKNLILLTDEPSNGDTINEAVADAILTSTGALLNGVLSGYSTTNSYDDLIADHGGSIFDLNQFNTTDQNVIDAFVQDFANRKLQEIIDTGGGTVPEPSTFVLLGLGLVGAAVARRRIQK